MAITKTWSINTLERELADGYVSKAIFRIDGEDGTYTFRATGEVNLPKPDTLVPYADLTEEVVLGWVKAKLNENKDEDGNTIDQVANIETAVENGVNIQKTPTHGTGKPW
mgnify:CR=1 FL=1|tara:strand:+ start:540 stop:869 length:330 start_codon:yes stop_codon:yes gene_type:complete